MFSDQYDDIIFDLQRKIKFLEADVVRLQTHEAELIQTNNSLVANLREALEKNANQRKVMERHFEDVLELTRVNAELMEENFRKRKTIESFAVEQITDIDLENPPGAVEQRDQIIENLLEERQSLREQVAKAEIKTGQVSIKLSNALAKIEQLEVLNEELNKTYQEQLDEVFFGTLPKGRDLSKDTGDQDE